MPLGRIGWALGALVAAVGVFISGAWAQARASRTVLQWPDSLEAVIASPQTHKVLYEDSKVRLLEIVIQPGETESMHGHRWPLIYAFNAPTPTYAQIYPDGSREDFKRNFEDADWKTPQCVPAPYSSLHKAMNTDSFPTHIYNLEFKRMDGRAIMDMKEYPE